MGWLTDAFRFWWGLLYWNVRKSLFRLRPRSRCPCQNPSDSGRALETGCDAANLWHDPARFRRVCPLLVDTPDGLRCSVDARDVRPFWLRAASYTAGAAVALYVTGVLGLFVGLRVVGYPLSPLTLAWPPRWGELRLARSAFFAAKAQRALDAHEVNEAILSLDIAFRNNPRNYDAGLRLAQLSSVGQPDFADQIFAILMRDHPDRRTATAEAWFRFLVVHGFLARAGELAAARVLEEPAQRPAWLHGLFSVTQHTGNDQPLRDLVAKHAAGLAPIDLALVNSELMVRQGEGLRLLPGLTQELPAGAGTYGAFYQVSRLTRLGRPEEALAMLNRYAAARRLPEADDFLLRLDVLAVLGHPEVLRTRLGQGVVNAREVELVCVHLVRHPDAGALAALAACVDRSHLPAEPATYAACTALLCAAGAGGDFDPMHAAAMRLKEISGARMVRLDAVEAFFRRRPDNAGINTILPMLPALSLEMVYALYDRFDEPPPAAAVTVRPR